MATTKKLRGDRKASKKKAWLLHKLKPGEAETVLHRLLETHPELGAETERIARSVLSETSFESVAHEVETALRALDWERVYGRAGGPGCAETELADAAWELLGEALEPFREDMKRFFKLGFEAEALEVCQGIVFGLYQVRNESGDGALGWARGFPAQAAANTVTSWYAAGSGSKFPLDFAGRFTPEWKSRIARVVRQPPISRSERDRITAKMKALWRSRKRPAT